MNLPVLGTIHSQNNMFVVMGVKIKAIGNLELSENPYCFVLFSRDCLGVWEN